MNIFDDFFLDRVSFPLYHYTSISSLIGISESRSIWASNAYYMNDSKEIVEACDILNHALAHRLSTSNYGKEEMEFLNQFKSWLNTFRTNVYNIFIFSLSEEPNLLSQWRSYTPHGKGVSVGFSVEKLNKLVEKEKVRMAPCIYDQKKQYAVMSNLLDKLIFSFQGDVAKIDKTKAHRSECYHPYLETFRGGVLQVLTVIKNTAFSEEKEWRIISPYYENYRVPEIFFREGASMLIPFIKLSLGDDVPHFKNVNLGPSQHQNLTHHALHMFLVNKGLSNSLSNSNIPYREWGRR